MPKRGTKASSKRSKKKQSTELEHAILKNLVELQKVHAGLAEKFDSLSKEISHLLALFELTARNFAKNAPRTAEYEKDKDFLEKIDKLLDQNKLLAKGLTIMEDRMRERMYAPRPQEKKPEDFLEPQVSARRPLPRF